jgi:hypothetical protein
MAVARLRNIPPRHAVVKGSATPSFDIETFQVAAPLATDRLRRSFTETVLKRSPYTIPATDARLTLTEQQRELFRAARAFDGGHTPNPLLDEDDDGLG